MEMNRQNSLKAHQTAILTATVVSIVLWFVPFLRWVTVPLQYLNTHIHEACHALTAVATGGMVDHIQVHANGNGETYTAGGSEFLISSAGYVGASIVGALILVLAKNGRAAKGVLIGLAVVMGYSLIVWVRQDVFGIASAIAWIAALVAMAIYLKDETRHWVAQFVGVQQCVNSVQSLFFLVKISGFGVRQSDAGNMQAATHIPALVWSILWCLVSFAAMGFALSISWRGESKTPGSPESKWAP